MSHLSLTQVTARLACRHTLLQQPQQQMQPLQQQQKQQQFGTAQHIMSLPSAPALSSHQQQHHALQELHQLAAVGDPRPRVHWLVDLLWIGVLNAVGLWAVLKVLTWSKDGEQLHTVVPHPIFISFTNSRKCSIP